MRRRCRLPTVDFWIFGSFRLAKPQSWWSRRFYTADKLQLSRLRFSD